jgi:hypothetical protein
MSVRDFCYYAMKLMDDDNLKELTYCCVSNVPKSKQIVFCDLNKCPKKEEYIALVGLENFK